MTIYRVTELTARTGRAEWLTEPIPGGISESRWKERGNCAGVGPEIFFPAKEQGSECAEAKETCRGCPVKTICLSHALTHEKYGVWGATSERQRRALRPKWGIKFENLAVTATEPACGTHEGFRRHKRRGEEPCDQCRHANSAYRSGVTASRSDTRKRERVGV